MHPCHINIFKKLNDIALSDKGGIVVVVGRYVSPRTSRGTSNSSEYPFRHTQGATASPNSKSMSFYFIVSDLELNFIRVSTLQGYYFTKWTKKTTKSKHVSNSEIFTTRLAWPHARDFDLNSVYFARFLSSRSSSLGRLLLLFPQETVLAGCDSSGLHCRRRRRCTVCMRCR